MNDQDNGGEVKDGHKNAKKNAEAKGHSPSFTKLVLLTSPLPASSLMEAFAIMPVTFFRFRPKAVRRARSQAILMSLGTPPEYL
jgi:hypothetical protein